MPSDKNLETQTITQDTKDIIKLKKLPRAWRTANKYYKIGMILMVFVNSILCVVNSYTQGAIPPMYWEIYSIVLSGLPVVWSKILDEVKLHQDLMTPSASSTQVQTPRSTMTSATTDPVL